MMTYKLSTLRSLLSAMVLTLVLLGCGKELSEENGGAVIDPPGGGGPGNGQGTAEGSVQGNGGSCGNFVLFGAFGKGLPMDTSNYVMVQVNVTTPGTIIISTDTLNGMYFAGSGTAAAAGTVMVKLNGSGTPATEGPLSFNVKWKGSTCTFQMEVYPTVAIGSGDYFPMTTNSNWTYLNNEPGAPSSDTSRQVSTGQQGSLPDGTTFNLFTTNYGTPPLDSAYYRKSGNDYRQLADVDIVGVSSAALLEDFIFLKDDQPVGTKWETSLLEGPASTGTGNVKTKRVFEIIGKGTKVAVHQKVYQSVIKVKVSQQVQNGSGGFDTVISYETWFAKGIGLVNLQAPAPYFGYGLSRHQVF